MFRACLFLSLLLLLLLPSFSHQQRQKNFFSARHQSKWRRAAAAFFLASFLSFWPSPLQQEDHTQKGGEDGERRRKVERERVHTMGDPHQDPPRIPLGSPQDPLRNPSGSPPPVYNALIPGFSRGDPLQCDPVREMAVGGRRRRRRRTAQRH